MKLISPLVFLGLIIDASGLQTAECKDIRPKCEENSKTHDQCLVKRDVNQAIYDEVSGVQGMQEQAENLQKCGSDWWPHSQIVCIIEGTKCVTEHIVEKTHFQSYELKEIKVCTFFQHFIKVDLLCMRLKLPEQNENFSEMLQKYNISYSSLGVSGTHFMSDRVHQSNDIKSSINKNWLLLIVLLIFVVIIVVQSVIIYRLHQGKQKKETVAPSGGLPSRISNEHLMSSRETEDL